MDIAKVPTSIVQRCVCTARDKYAASFWVAPVCHAAPVFALCLFCLDMVEPAGNADERLIH